VIIDITGVPAVDTMVAQHLLQTVAAERLTGAECVISGLRPVIGQTMAEWGSTSASFRPERRWPMHWRWRSSGPE
jgi:anti-anti-sigma regulatory factor